MESIHIVGIYCLLYCPPGLQTNFKWINNNSSLIRAFLGPPDDGVSGGRNDETSACPLCACSNNVSVMMVILNEELEHEMWHIKLRRIRSNVDFDVTLQNSYSRLVIYGIILEAKMGCLYQAFNITLKLDPKRNICFSKQEFHY